MDPAVAALDIAKAGVILANMIESYLAGGAPPSNPEGAEHDDLQDRRSTSVAGSLHLHSSIDDGGLDRIYVQAKRYADGNTVGAGAIRDFFGSLDRFKASKGLFVTTSAFSSSARNRRLAEQTHCFDRRWANGSPDDPSWRRLPGRRDAAH